MFTDELSMRNLDHLVKGNTFRKVLPFKTRELFSVFDEIINTNAMTYIDPDCDCDGCFSALEMKLMFDVIGFNNYIIPAHSFKRHDLDVSYVDNLMAKYPNIKYALLLDSSSNSLNVVERFKSYGVFTVIIDHHNTLNLREDFANRNCLIINARIDSMESGEESILHDLSAGAICSLIIDAYVKLKHPQCYSLLNGYHWVYGAITIYSDSCKSNLYNITFLRTVHDTLIELPPIVEFFLDKYSMFNRSFISFNLVPRINSLIRNENFIMVWKLFFDFESFKREYSLDDINKIYNQSREFTNELKESVKITNYNNFTLAIIDKSTVSKARNYTGLVANKIASDSGERLCIVLMEYINGIYEGSVRDPLNRDILSVFKKITQADGHPSAFGVSINSSKLEETLINIDDMLNNLSFTKDVITVNWDTYNNIHEIQQDINSMMLYNEYCLHPYPKAYALIVARKGLKIKRYPKVNYIAWNSYEIVCPLTTVNERDVILISPTIDKTGYKLMGRVYNGKNI